MANLFLSYSRKDETAARRLTSWLEQEGHDVWRDEDDIGGGASFSSEIEKALEQSDGVLVLWSANSVQSSWVRDEAGFGRDKGKLIPFVIDGTEPPLGFRQFQAINLSKWKGRGAPPAAERIGAALERLGGRTTAEQPNPAEQRSSRRRFRASPRGIAAAIALCAAVGAAGFFIWHGAAADAGITIAVSASPSSSDRATAADYANVAAADLASYLPTRFDGATVIAPADVDSGTTGYRMLVAAGHHSASADASLTLSDRDGRSLLWSKSWTVPDASAVDLRERLSQSVSQAALCLAKARGGPTRLDQPALGLYIGGCTGLFDPTTSNEQLSSTWERVVKLAPDFAEGWAGVAMSRAIYAESLQDRSGRVDEAAVASAHQAIARARELDPHSGFPYLAEWHLVRDDPLRGLALLDKAVAIDPDEPVLYARLSNSLMSVGRMDDAVQAAKRAVELDPLWSFTRGSYINALTYAGQFSRAAAEIADARAKWPNNSEIDQADFDYQYRYGDPRAAEKLLPSMFPYADAELVPFRKMIAARVDPTAAKVDEAIASVAAAKRTQLRDQDAYLLALASFGRTEEALRLLGDPQFQRSLEPDVLFRPEFAKVRADRRFMSVAARLGLVRYWRRSGEWPDFCAGEQLSYDCKTEAAKYG